MPTSCCCPPAEIVRRVFQERRDGADARLNEVCTRAIRSRVVAVLVVLVNLEVLQLGLELGDAIRELLDVLVDARPRIDRLLDVLDRAAHLAVDLPLPVIEALLGMIDPLSLALTTTNFSGSTMFP